MIFEVWLNMASHSLFFSRENWILTAKWPSKTDLFFQCLTKKFEVMWFCTQFFPDCSLQDLGKLHSNSFLGYYNDGYCDDNLNNYVCNFDGGDCCRNTSIFMYCSDCSCIWDVTNYPILTTSNTSSRKFLLVTGPIPSPPPPFLTNSLYGYRMWHSWRWFLWRCYQWCKV